MRTLHDKVCVCQSIQLKSKTCLGGRLDQLSRMACGQSIGWLPGIGIGTKWVHRNAHGHKLCRSDWDSQLLVGTMKVHYANNMEQGRIIEPYMFDDVE